MITDCQSFADLIERAIGLLQGFTAEKIKDGEIADAELDQIQGELEAIPANDCAHPSSHIEAIP